MRDLVETVIAQVIKEPYGPGQRSDQPVRNRSTLSHQIRGAAPASGFDSSQVKDAKLWEACCKFEAIFMQQMMSAMRKSIPKSDFLPHGFAENVQGSMLDQAIAETGARQGNMGIAVQMYRQLERSNTEGSNVEEGEMIQGIQQATDNVAMTMYNDIKEGTDGSN